MKTTVTAVRHIASGLYLYNGQWVDLPEQPDPDCLNPLSDIKYRGQHSDGIIDTNYFSPEDFGKTEWDDDDDTTDDYEEAEIEINGYVVNYYNFMPDYSLPHHVGGHCNWYETFNTLEEAQEYLDNLDDYYRGSIVTD